MQKLVDSKLVPGARERLEAMRETAISCPACRDHGLLYPRKPDGKPDYSRVVPCQCRQTAIQAEARKMRFDLADIKPDDQDLFDTFSRNDRNKGPFMSALGMADGDAPFLWLVLTGPTGNGKTHLARAVAQRVLNRGLSVRFVYVPTWIRKLRAAQSPDSPVNPSAMLADLEKCDLLVLDDLGGQYDSNTGWAWAQLEDIIGGRYDAVQRGEQKLLVVTTNKNMQKEFPKPILSRLEDVRLSCIEVNLDEDHRPNCPA